MTTFVIIATRGPKTLSARVLQVEATSRLEVEAATLSDAYSKVRAIPEFRHSHLRPE